jgi:hypothetical protein
LSVGRSIDLFQTRSITMRVKTVLVSILDWFLELILKLIFLILSWVLLAVGYVLGAVIPLVAGAVVFLALFHSFTPIAALIAGFLTLCGVARMLEHFGKMADERSLRDKPP